MRQDRRKILKLVLASTAFGVGLGGVMKFDPRASISTGTLHAHFGMGEAQAACGSAYNCAGGGGRCGDAYECAGGGGKCGSAYNCAGS